MTKSFLLIALIFTHTAFASPPLFIAIAGGSGSGKTTLAEKIQQAFPADSIIVSQDSYYKELKGIPFEAREKWNLDHPDGLDIELLQGHLIDLKNNRPIETPIYNFFTHSRENETELLEPKKIVLVEGILVLTFPELRELFDIKIYVDTDSDLRILRRIERDIRERGRDFAGIKERYERDVKPMHDLFVESSKQYADIIIQQGGHNPIARDLILSRIRQELK